MVQGSASEYLPMYVLSSDSARAYFSMSVIKGENRKHKFGTFRNSLSFGPLVVVAALLSSNAVDYY